VPVPPRATASVPDAIASASRFVKFAPEPVNPVALNVPFVPIDILVVPLDDPDLNNRLDVPDSICHVCSPEPVITPSSNVFAPPIV